MSVQVVYKNLNKLTNSGVFALFVDEKYKINSINKFFSSRELLFIKNFLKNKNLKESKFWMFNLSEKKTIILISSKEKSETKDQENLGAEFFNFLKNNNLNSLTIYSNFLSDKFFCHFVHGLKLKSYDFNLYKSKKIKKNIKINIQLMKSNFSKKYIKKLFSLESGTNFARDLVSEPPNILFPEEYVKRLLKLRKIGIKVTVYNETKMRRLGMNSLLGVGRGSSKSSYLVTLEWYGNRSNKKNPLSFVGKGVCFDTGGISLKPAKFMEEMKYDMAGSAVVAGLMKSLAMRKAKVNAIGVVGLVENMPGGNAQRPGDIVKSYSGKTIEILNTDAEGRLVLADALTFTEKKFKPKFIIDLATLTGAIIVSLGEEYAGLFSNNNDLSDKLYKSGLEVNEKVWRLPLDKNYDKLINSPVADMQNINYAGGAGSITAAQFLQRFILYKTPWAHLDIAGMAFSKKAANLNPSGATGFGVRLLNNLIEKYYE